MLLDEILQYQTRRYTVAVENKKIVGYLGVMFVIDELHVNTIGTLPGQEGRGIATSLMDDAWRDARTRGIKRATLEVATSNVRPRSSTTATALNRWAYERITTKRRTRTRWCCGPICRGRPARRYTRAPYAGQVRVVLGIETSCDETAAAVVNEDYHVISSVIESSLDQHRAFGGVVPELAVART